MIGFNTNFLIILENKQEYGLHLLTESPLIFYKYDNSGLVMKSNLTNVIYFMKIKHRCPKCKSFSPSESFLSKKVKDEKLKREFICPQCQSTLYWNFSGQLLGAIFGLVIVIAVYNHVFTGVVEWVVTLSFSSLILYYVFVYRYFYIAHDKLQ